MSEPVITRLRHKTMRAIMLGFEPKHAYLGRIEHAELMREILKYGLHLRHDPKVNTGTVFEGLTIHEVKEESYIGVGN